MSIGTLDRAASLNHWRHRALAEKALVGLGFLALAVALPPWPGAALVGVVILGFTFLGARVPLRLWLVAVSLPMGFLFTGALMLLLQVNGDGIAFAPEGARDAALLCLRAVAATFCLMFMAFTTPANELIGGLRRLRVPAEIVELALLTYRFVFLLADEAVAMTTAQRARLGHSTRRRWLRSAAMVIANLLPRAMARAHRMEIGLAARGWQGQMPSLTPPRPISPGRIAFVVALQALVILVAVQV